VAPGAARTQAELGREASDIAPQTVGDGLARLEAEGVVITDGKHVVASRVRPCLMRKLRHSATSLRMV
jgi:hypothetical protein